MEYKYGSYGVQCYGGDLVEDGVLADFPLVGSNRHPSSELCNVFSQNLGCLDSFKHDFKVVPEGVFGDRTIDGKIPKGSAVIHPHAFHCFDPLCPLCCYAWAKREVNHAMMRFRVFDLVFGKDFELRHLVVSVPEFDWDKSVEFMRRQVASFSVGVGVVGSMCIYHPKRYSKRLDCWYFSPHFHLLGYVAGGKVDGLLVRDVHNLSGYVLKNLDARKSVVGTILYQLSHAGVPSNHRHAVCWLGELNYRKNLNNGLRDLYVQDLKDERLRDKRKLCPVCGGVMVHVCRHARASVGFDYKKFEDVFVLDSVDNWVLVPKKDYSKFSKGEGCSFSEFDL